MKTKYLAQAELQYITGLTTRPYVQDLSGFWFVGLLSSLPNNFAGGSGDNWEGAAELFSNPATPLIHPVTNESIPGIDLNTDSANNPNFGYLKAFINKANQISDAFPVFNEALQASGMAIEFPVAADIQFNVANGGDWGLVVGVAVFAFSTITPLRGIPIMVGELSQPVTILEGQRFTLSKEEVNRIRFVELTRRLPLV